MTDPGIVHPGKLEPAEFPEGLRAVPSSAGWRPERDRLPATRWNIRHQPVYLVRSACFQKSGALTCVRCHDPHAPLLRNDVAHYDAGLPELPRLGRRLQSRKDGGLRLVPHAEVEPQEGLRVHEPLDRGVSERRVVFTAALVGPRYPGSRRPSRRSGRTRFRESSRLLGTSPERRRGRLSRRPGGRVVKGLGGDRVAVAELLLRDAQRLAVERLGLVELTLHVVETAEVDERRGGVGMLGAQGLAADRRACPSSRWESS